MKDEKTKHRQEKLIEMVSNFCDEKLNDEYKELSINLIQKMGRKHNVPFKRGKLENWASAIIYALGQINFLFDKSFEPYATPDDICNYFKTKKSTASNKARDIRDMFKLGHFDSEFSTASVRDSQPRLYMDRRSGLIVNEDFVKNKMNGGLESVMDRICKSGDNIPDELHFEFILKLMNSSLFCYPISEGAAFLETYCGSRFFPFFTSYEEYRKSFPDAPNPIIYPFYEFCEIAYDNNGDIGCDGVKLNPDSQDLTISPDMMIDFYEMVE